MTRHSTIGKSRAGPTLAAAVLLCGIAGAWPAAAQDSGLGFGRADNAYGYRRNGDEIGDRRSGSYRYRSDFGRVGHEAFERGYRAGRDDERSRSGRQDGGEGDDRSGDRHRFADLGWNDAGQKESRERLELAAARLREALVLLRRQPSGQRLDEASEQARQALIRVQNAMTWLPHKSDAKEDDDQHRYERRSGQAIGAERASGGWRS